jgi:hypothetical protein
MSPKMETKIIRKSSKHTEEIENRVKATSKSVTRLDVMLNMISLVSRPSVELFKKIMECDDEDDVLTEVGTSVKSRGGYIYETICIILILTRCFNGLDYAEIYEGFLHELRPIKDAKILLDMLIGGGGNNCADMAFSSKNVVTGVIELIGVSVKYWNKYTDGDCDRIEGHKLSLFQSIKVALIVKSKQVQNHEHHDKGSTIYQALETVNGNNMLFDKDDVITAITKFKEKFSSGMVSVENELVPITKDNILDFINTEYLGKEARVTLRMKMHQKMTVMNLMEQYNNDVSKGGKDKMFCIDHKPRSGKSITLLNVCLEFFATGLKRILIMTSVPDTIKSFVDDLDKYHEFANVKYVLQDGLELLDDSYCGIVFCSVQYLKNDQGVVNKRDLLKKMDFEVIMIDESHYCSSTDKTRNEIMNANDDVSEIYKKSKVVIFASGTPDKTCMFYRIQSPRVLSWEVVDETMMKTINKEATNEDETEIRHKAIGTMKRRHGVHFTTCLNDRTLQNDYIRCPDQKFLKGEFNPDCIKELNAYNELNGTNLGFSCSSLLALKYEIKNGVKVYSDKFAVCDTSGGIELLTTYFKGIIGGDNDENTIMGDIEKMQSMNNSRITSVENPLMFIVYLPVNTGNGQIDLLMKAIMKFMKENKLWTKFNLEYSCGISDSSTREKVDYNVFIEDCMTRTRGITMDKCSTNDATYCIESIKSVNKCEKGAVGVNGCCCMVKNPKKGCILFLGNKGSVGVTYKHCDVTISLDTGHNLDSQKQRYARALTDHAGKTIGINVDMDIHRTYLNMSNMIKKVRSSCEQEMTKEECLMYAYKNKMFSFDEHLFGLYATDDELRKHFTKEIANMTNNIDDGSILEQIVCEIDVLSNVLKNYNVDDNDDRKKLLNQDESDCPKPGKELVTTYTRPSKEQPDGQGQEEVEEQSQEEVEIVVMNKTLHICKTKLFPILALVSRTHETFNVKNVLDHYLTIR